MKTPRHDKRSDLPAPMVISDQTDIQSQADGLHYDSKSAYRASLKAKGYHEVGNDSAYCDPKPPEMTTPGGLEADIKTAMDQLEGKL